MSFRISGLPAEAFSHLFTLDNAALAQHGGVRRVATGAEPCRVSLTDAQPGDPLVLVNYEHHPVDGPYRGRYAVFVRPGETRFDAVDTIPDQLRRRRLAVRSFDADGISLRVELAEAGALQPAIGRHFADGRAAYLHLHYPAAGCYAARVDRA